MWAVDGPHGRKIFTQLVPMFQNANSVARSRGERGRGEVNNGATLWSARQHEAPAPYPGISEDASARTVLWKDEP